jgi:hypothetical protein
LGDEKMKMLSLEEIGAWFMLCNWMWINDYERGCLFCGHKKPIPDWAIAKFLHVTEEKFQELHKKIVEDIPILKRGRHGELYSERLRKFRTPQELAGAGKNTIKTNKTSLKQIKRPELEVELELEKELKKDINTLVELFNSTCPSLPKIKTVSKSRKTKIQLRLKEHPDLEWWKGVFEKADKILIKNWRPSFDWLIENDRNAVKVDEGNYDKPKETTWRDSSDKG